jgi:hypothetical protein
VECTCLFLPPPHRPSPFTLAGSASRVFPSKRFHDGSLFRDCSHFFMFRPPSLLASPIVPTAATHRRRAAEALNIRAEHASLPPHASDLLTIRTQAIDGVGTCTPRDSQPCRLLQCKRDLSTVILNLRPYRLENPIPINPTVTSASDPSRSADAFSPKRPMPTSADPAVPIPVQMA